MPRRSIVLGLVVVLIALAILSGEMIGGTALAVLESVQSGRETLSGHWLMLVILLAYVLLLAVPFVPGAEIGVMLMMVLGADGAPLVYGATVAGLLLAYSIGRQIPETSLQHLFERVGFVRAAKLLRQRQILDPLERQRLSARQLPAGWMAWLALRPVLVIAVLLNMPGNSLVGGGGGIALVTGVSRMIGYRQFGLCVLVAVAPVPLVVWLTG